MILLIILLCFFERIHTFGAYEKTRKMKFVGFVIAIIIASSAFFTLAAISVGSVVLFKKAEEEEEIPLD